VTIPRTDLERVFTNLRAGGRIIIGPTVRQDTIVLAEIASIADLPAGWTDEQTPGRYRTRRTGQQAWFSFAAGPGAWQGFLYPPRVSLFRTDTSSSSAVRSMKINATLDTPPRLALIGVRACDLQAIRIADRVLLGGSFRDPHYAARREDVFILAVNCSRPSANCFCSSMECGPRVSGTFDLAVTELDDVLVIEVGSDAGANVLEGTAWTAATAWDLDRAADVIRDAERSITRDVRTDHLGSFLFENLESPHWKDVASRCLGCGNCTMVCPTCFCTTVTDTIDFSERTERLRLWDSCFNSEFSHVHGGNARPSVRARYRQWLTHKFAAYREQYGVLGCVGCGRCITWCPAGIDVTEELKALRATGVK
jgi:sulfhydrogenase subunit beta (sulfur reductase)